MNLEKLFEIQKVLDERIINEKGLQGQDLLDKKILALQVELGELAQNWRGFKFWSKDQEPRTHYERMCHVCKGKGVNTVSIFPEITREACAYCEETGFEEKKNPLLEEYVDCLHFILSIGLELGYQNVGIYRMDTSKDGITEFNLLMANVSGMWLSSTTKHGMKFRIKEDYRKAFSIFLSLGEMLGFTWEQIEQAYLEKNRVNQERQANGY